MTEEEWLTCTFSTAMFEWLRAKRIGSCRKHFLLSLACCHPVAGRMSHDGRRAVEVAERFVAGLTDETERWAVFETAGVAMDEAADLRTHTADWCAYRLVQLAAERDSPASWNDDLAAQIAQTAPEAFAWTGTHWDETILQAHRSVIAAWVRDIFGNPFRAVTIDSAWRSPTVLSLTETINDKQAFDLLPSLADALKQAGCDDSAILDHCREPGTHVRGCWLIDLILGI